jgi:hypothetical protein
MDFEINHVVSDLQQYRGLASDRTITKQKSEQREFSSGRAAG